MPSFQIDDVVLVTHNYMGASITGLKARVIGYHDRHGISLEFDQPVPGIGFYERHSCRGKSKLGYCWNVPPEYLELVEEDGKSPVEKKCRRLWNKSRFVKAHPTFAY